MQIKACHHIGRISALREKLKLPPKTSDNSSTPPAAGQKSNGDNTRRPKGKAHISKY